MNYYCKQTKGLRQMRLVMAVEAKDIESFTTQLKTLAQDE
jgi:hypothetical protein